MKRLVRDWEERSSSGASETGSEDDDDDDGLVDEGDGSPRAVRRRESERLYRRRSSLKNRTVASVQIETTSSSEGTTTSGGSQATPPPPPYAFDHLVVQADKSTLMQDSVVSPSTAERLTFTSTDTASAEHALEVGFVDPVNQTTSPLTTAPSAPDLSASNSLPTSTKPTRDRKSYDGLGSHLHARSTSSSDEREDRRVLTVKPRKPAPSTDIPSFTTPLPLGKQEREVDQLKDLVAALSNRMRALEGRLDLLEARPAALPQVEPVVKKVQDEEENAPMTLSRLPGYVALVGLGLVIVAWGVFTRSRRGRA